MEKLWNLLEKEPVLSISLGFVSACFLAWLFRDVIKSFLKKKYELYSKEEISQHITHEFDGSTAYKIIKNLGDDRK